MSQESEVGLPDAVSLGIGYASNLPNLAIDLAGYTAASSMRAGLVTVTFGVVDVSDAMLNGSSQDVFEQLIGIGGALGGALVLDKAGAAAGLALTGGHPVGGVTFGFIGSVAGGFLGEAAAEAFAGSLYDSFGLTADPDTAPHTPTELPVYVFTNASIGQQSYGYDLPISTGGAVTSVRVMTSISTNANSGSVTPITTIVPLTNPITGTNLDLLRGNVYDPNNVGVGQELNGLDRISHEMAVAGQTYGFPNTSNGNSSSDASDNGNHNDNDDDDDNWSPSPGWNDSGQGSLGGPSNGNNPGGGFNHGGSGTTTGNDWAPSGGQWEGGNGNQNHGTPDPGLPVNPDYVGIQPIVLDLDGDGIEVSLSYSASFDYDGDGFRERTAWAAADDGFLVIDLNADGTRGAGDGQIDQRSERVARDWGPEGSTDLQALAEATDEDGNLLFDTNGDGVLDANDTSYGEFRVWQGLDQDGEVDEGELGMLIELGISQIYGAL